MAFNNWVNFFIILAGILNFIGVFGGVLFFIYFYHLTMAKLSEDESEEEFKCESCSGYNACFGAFGGDLPEDGCAYYKSDEEVEISAN